MKEINYKKELKRFIICTALAMLVVYYLSDIPNFIDFLKKDGPYILMGSIFGQLLTTFSK